jgi:hypothetical protein
MKNVMGLVNSRRQLERNIQIACQYDIDGLMNVAEMLKHTSSFVVEQVNDEYLPM